MVTATSSARRSRVASWAPWAGLAVLLGAAGAFVLWETRGTVFWFDEWLWIAERRDLSADSLLDPHNQHLSLVPVAIYRVLLDVFGLAHYWPYRFVLAAAQLSCGLAIFLYARSRVGPLLGLAAAAPILFLGAGWQNILWPFQIAWLISLAAGIGALLALDRRTRGGDVAAALLLALSLASSGVGVPFVVAVAVAVALERRRWRAGLIVAIPLAVYGLWWVAYQTPGPSAHMALVDVPLWVLRAACASLLAIFGLLRHEGTLLRSPDVPLLLGVPLLLAAVALAGWRLHRLQRVPARVLALLAGLLTFWVATAFQRGVAAPPGTSRYVYAGSVFLVLLAVELARGATIRPRAAGAIAAVALVAVAVNVPLLHDAAVGLRQEGQETRVALGVVELAGANARPSEPITILPGYPLVVIETGDYLAALRAWGPSPAASPEQIVAGSNQSTSRADTEIARLDGASAERVAWQRPQGEPPRVDAIAKGRLDRAGACVRFAAATADASAIDFTMPRDGLLVRAAGGPSTISLRRFSGAFFNPPVAEVPAGTATRLRIAPDRAPQPWHVHVRPQQSVTVCTA